MTAPGRPYPEGAYGKHGTMRGYQDIDEAEATRRMRKPIDDANNVAHSRLFGELFSGFPSLGALLGDVALALGGDGTFGPGPLRDIRDGQSNYNDRVDLLEGVRGYGAAYMTANPAVVSRSTRMPFTGRLGPLKGVRLLPAGGLLLESEGLWHVSATTLAKSTLFTGGNETVMHLSVRTPGGSAVYSEIPDVKRPGASRITHHMAAPFVTPEPNCEVHVWVTSERWRNFAGGTQYSRLSAIKHDNEADATGVAEYPDEPIES
ncbi:hypothetical protein [Rhodococcus sp. BH5]|uniref:hypothetical protein n=1 Tax=Rhodococcus sp. BH5 TaxID=2871702 RepID=UPI0022CDA0CE|nr:hypothetical protein [Rhodococcus sp. BH5]MCZ9635165.1 hypothetical protein [Rhodococcus sp. BH5]